MIISVYLYKDGVEIYKYNGGIVPVVKLMEFPKEMQKDVLKLLKTYLNKNQRLNIHTYTSELFSKDMHI